MNIKAEGIAFAIFLGFAMVACSISGTHDVRVTVKQVQP